MRNLSYQLAVPPLLHAAFQRQIYWVALKEKAFRWIHHQIPE